MNRSAITDVAGIEVGHFTDPRRPTGCTVVIAREGAIAGVDVRGAAPGTRETDLLAPTNLVDCVHGILLAGGSAWGLDAATGVVRWLEEQGVGFPVGPVRLPIVPGAVLFDLLVGDATIRPDAAAGYSACESASAKAPAEGNVGAGAGAAVGKIFGIERAMKGGIGTASVTLRWRHRRRADCLQCLGRRDRSYDGPAHRGRAHGRRQGLARYAARPASRRGAQAAAARHQHHHRRDSDRCRDHQGPGLAPRNHGPRRPGAQHQPGAHHVRRRHAVRAGHRPRRTSRRA